MKFRNSLKNRIIIAFLAFSTLLTTLFAVTALSIREHLQTNLIGQTIKEDLDDYMQRLANDPEKTIGEPISKNVTGLLTTPEKLPLQLPLHYADLSDGVHEVEEDGKIYKVAVNKKHQYQDSPIWGYVKYDISHISRENNFVYLILAGVFVLFLIIAYLLALVVSRKALKPLSELASRVGNLGNNIHPDILSTHFPDDEVGKLAQALDDYAERLTNYVIRDKEFNADVSHELRTPLTIITSTVELLMSNPSLDEKIKGRILRIERAARQSTELIETLLLLAREERKEHKDFDRTAVGRIVKNIIQQFEPTLQLKPLQTRIVENDWLQVKAPPSVVSVVLSNLIGNAIKYTPSGTITITIDKYSVTVSDQGEGVDEAELPKLFDRHFRGKKVTSKGSGLGLAIVKRLCDLYHWHIDIRKNEHNGLSAELTFREASKKISA